MPPRAQRNFKLRKDLSVRVIKAWLELLRLEGGILTWAYWDLDETVIREIFERYNLSECMGISPPYHKSKYNCETFLKSTETYLTQSDIDRTLDDWIRTLGNEEEGDDDTSEKVLMLKQSGQEDGIKSVVAEKSRALLCMLDFWSDKQLLGDEMLRAHEIFIPLQYTALRTRDSVVREETPREQGIRDIKLAITSIESLFEKCKNFLALEPSEEGLSGCTLAFGPDPVEEDLSEASLATMLIEVEEKNPLLMRHTNPSLGTIRDDPYFAELLEALIEEATRVSELNAFREERNRDRAVKSRVLSRDIEAIKTELQEFDSGGWRISLLRDYIDQLHELKKRWNQIQAMEENVLVMAGTEGTGNTFSRGKQTTLSVRKASNRWG